MLLSRQPSRLLGYDEQAPIRPDGTRRDDRGEESRRRGVLDVAGELWRQPAELTQPVDRQLLELLQRRRRAPQDPDLIETGDE